MPNKVTHVIDCYDSPCVHFSRPDAAYRWYCSCGETGKGDGLYASTLLILTEHMNSCGDKPEEESEEALEAVS